MAKNVIPNVMANYGSASPVPPTANALPISPANFNSTAGFITLIGSGLVLEKNATVDVQGSGFKPNTNGTLISGGFQLGNFTTDAIGGFIVTLTYCDGSSFGNAVASAITGNMNFITINATMPTIGVRSNTIEVFF